MSLSRPSPRSRAASPFPVAPPRAESANEPSMAVPAPATADSQRAPLPAGRVPAARVLPYLGLGLIVLAGLWQWRKAQLTYGALRSELTALRLAYRELAARPPAMADPPALPAAPMAKPIPKAIPVDEDPIAAAFSRDPGETGTASLGLPAESVGAGNPGAVEHSAGSGESAKAAAVPAGSLPSIPSAVPEERTVELERVVQFLRQELNAAHETIERLKAASPSAE